MFPSPNTFSRVSRLFCVNVLVSGFEELLKKNPAAEVMMSYEHCVRANIFRRDQTNVTSIESMKRMMRYNNYQVDPLSLGNPGYAIASRFDLRGTGSVQIL